ncbi:MAG: SIR2 family protein, partial [Anaerolineae bacterium]
MANLQLSPDLSDALAHRNLVVFWGGDLPQALTGLPSRQDLAQRLAARSAYQGRDTSLEAVAQAFAAGQHGFTNELNRIIIRELDEQRHQPQLVHRLAAQLPASHYIVTAYDGLLEDALRDQRRPYNYPIIAGVSVGNLDLLNGNLPTLIWLYGRVREQQSLVLTRDAHLRLVNDPANAGLLNYVRTIMRVNTLLFIGYDLSDVDFELLYTHVLTTAGPLMRRAFAVQPGLDPYQRLTWQQRNVELIDADPLAVLSSLLGLPLPPASDLQSPTPDPQSPVSDLRSPIPGPSPTPAKEPTPMPTLPNSITLNRLLQKLTAQDIDIILLEQDFQGVRDSAGPNLHSLRLKLIEFAEKRVKVPRLLELIYDLNSTGYLEIMGVPPPGRSTGSTSSSGQGGNASPGPTPPPPPTPASVRRITYHDFDLRIRRGAAAGQYSVETTSVLGGQAEAEATFDPGETDFKRLLNRFGVLRGFADDAAAETPTGRTPGPVRPSQPPAERDLALLGYRLQQLAFPPAVYHRLA